MYLIFAMGVGMSVGLTSCTKSAFKKDVSTNYFTKSNIVNFPLVSDLQVGAKKTMAMRLYTETTVAAAKENILYDFMKEHNCDVVVEPMFSVEIISKGTSAGGKVDVKIEMTGFVGNYANIRNFEPKDSEKFWLEKKASIGDNNSNNVSDKTNTATTKKSKNKFLKVLAGIGIGVASVFVLLVAAAL